MNPHNMSGLQAILSESKSLLAASDYPSALELLRVSLRRLESELPTQRRAEILKFMGLIAEAVGDETEAGTLYCTAQRILPRSDNGHMVQSLGDRLRELAVEPRKNSLRLSGHPEAQQNLTRAAIGWIDIFLGNAKGWESLLGVVDQVSFDNPIHRWFVPEIRRMGHPREDFGELVRRNVHQQRLQAMLLEGNSAP